LDECLRGWLCWLVKKEFEREEEGGKRWRGFICAVEFRHSNCVSEQGLLAEEVEATRSHLLIHPIKELQMR